MFFIFSTTSIRNIFRSDKYFESYSRDMRRNDTHVSSCKCPLRLSDFNHIEICRQILLQLYQCQILWKSDRRFLNCSMRTYKQTDDRNKGNTRPTGLLPVIKKEERSSDIRWTTRGMRGTGKSSISCHSLQSPWIEVHLNQATSPAVLPTSWF
jgi:hypothetical protein